MRELCCKHIFHTDCFESWVYSGGGKSCPMRCAQVVPSARVVAREADISISRQPSPQVVSDVIQTSRYDAGEDHGVDVEQPRETHHDDGLLYGSHELGATGIGVHRVQLDV